VVATSATGKVAEVLLQALGRSDLPTVDADAVGSAKPAPDLLLAACESGGWEPTQATLVGDSPWDAEAASRIGMRAVAVRTGGFGDGRLLDAGARAVVDDPRALVGRL
ncbi:MAG TPA: HAD-IA family hydrolase, partial [Egibacteraceae bacterium]